MSFKGKKYDHVSSEEEIVEFWNKNNIFQKSINPNNKPFVFYDGPPFATGLPHYGHIVGGMIKDTIGRWATINGYYVPRRAGWDTHGLPIEYEIEKKFGIKTKDQIIEFGIGPYNEACRDIVMTYAAEWKTIMNRLGRWVDFDDDYKTMDLDFMSRVWTVFSKIYEKGLIYEGVKIMPYSIACTTPLSNFEATSNYQNVSDRTVIVLFKIKNSDENILSWTTTPWTLPGHYCLCVNKNIVYILVEYNQLKFYFAKSRLEFLASKLKTDISNMKIIKEVLGSELVGLEYNPPYNFCKRDKYVIVEDNFVSDDSGTGVVHIAPAYGEDDYRVCMEKKLITKDLSTLFIHINESGKGINCDMFNDLDIKSMTKSVLKNLQNENKSLIIFDYEHNYPFCWRSDTPLIYKAVKCWFLNVESIKDRMVEINKGINWIPENIGKTRFNSWLENTRDWCISRNRYWGTPIPVWKSNDGDIIVVESKEKLEELTGIKIVDLHRHHVDQIIINQNGKEYKRIDTVLDCWFESGSVPFASPNAGYPAHFIAEGLDQTRGWFYTLLVIGTILENRSPYQNVIVNGLVLAADGKKMSKRLKNYPDPIDVVNQFGSDALRYYLIMSGASMASELRFKNEDVKQVLQTVIIPLTNSMAFFDEYYKLYSKDKEFIEIDSDLPFDKWILKRTYDFIKEYSNSLNRYEINPIDNLLIKYINDLNNNYIRLNRDIMKGKDPEDSDLVKCCKALSTLKKVLNILCSFLNPILPFLSEKIYQNINKDKLVESVHLLNINDIDIEKYNIQDSNKNIQDSNKNIQDYNMINNMLNVIDMIRSIRNKKNIQLKKPLKSLTIQCDDYNKELFEKVENFILSEGNILEMEIKKWEATHYNYQITINPMTSGKLFKSKNYEFVAFMNQQNQETLKGMFDGTKNITFNDVNIDSSLVSIFQTIADPIESYEEVMEDNINKIKIKLNIEMDQNTTELYIAKNIATTFQRLRKFGGFHVYDNLRLIIKTNEYKNIIEKHMNYIMKTTRVFVEVLDVIEEKYDFNKIIEINEIECDMYLLKISSL